MTWFHKNGPRVIGAYFQSLIAAAVMLALSFPAGGAKLDNDGISLRSARTGIEDSVISYSELRALQLPRATRKLLKSAIKLDKKGSTSEALVLVERALESAPDYVEAHTAAAIANLKLGRMQEAQRHLDQAFEIDSTLLPAQEAQGVLLFEMGRYADAREVLEAIVKKTPSRVTAQRLLAEARQAICDTECSEPVSDCSTEGPPRARRAHVSGLERVWRGLVSAIQLGFMPQGPAHANY